MSHTMELLAEVEHGTVTGYRAGCHGSAVSCGSVVSCATVYTRYQGDWGFRRRIDAGEDPVGIFAGELAEAEAVRARDREAQRKARAAASRSARGRAVKQKRERAKVPAVPRKDRLNMDELTRLHSEGLSDVAIGRKLGFSAMAVGLARKRVGLPVNRKPAAAVVPSVQAERRRLIRELHGEGLTDKQIGERLGMSRDTAMQARNRLGLPPNRESRIGMGTGPRSKTLRADVAALHAKGYTDRDIASELGVSSTWVGELRREAGLKANRRPR